MKEERKVIAYARLSEDDKEKTDIYSTSIYNQLNIIRDYARTMGYTLDKEYIDDGYSGINFDRPSFNTLKDDIEQGKISTIITKDISRLGRNFIETAYYISEFFPKNDVRYIAIDDKYDSDDPNSIQKDIIVGVKSIINDRYVKDTSIKRKHISFSKTERGEFIGVIAPYGYKIVKENGIRSLAVDDYAANIVKRIFVDIASGKSRAEVAAELNKEKIVPPIIYMNMTFSKKKKYYCDWSDKIIYRIIKNQTYMGKLIIRKTEKKNYNQKKRDYIPIRDRRTKDNTHPAIISETLFAEANSKLKTLKRREKNNYSGAFSGLIICGECGRVMTTCRKKNNQGNIKYYFECTRTENRKKCPNRTIFDSKLNAIVKDTLTELIKTFVDDDSIIDTATKDLIKSDKYNLKISNIKKTMTIHDNNIRDLYIKKSKGEISLDEFIKLKKDESQARDDLEKEMAKLIQANNYDSKRKMVQDLYNKFIDKDIMLKHYIKEVIEKIVIHKDDTVEIVFKFGIAKTKTIKLY